MRLLWHVLLLEALGQLAGNPQGRPAASASIETHMTLRIREVLKAYYPKP